MYLEIPFIFGLLFSLLACGRIYTFAETYDEVLAECLNNARNIHLCRGYNGIVTSGQTNFLKKCEPLNRHDCTILLRAKVQGGPQGTVYPQVHLTVAAKFDSQARNRELRIDFGFLTFRPGSGGFALTPHAVGVQGVRRTNGDLSASLFQQRYPTVDLYESFPQTVGRTGLEVHGNETTIVLSYALPSNAISVDGRHQYRYTSYERAYIVAAYLGEQVPKGVLPDFQKEEIFQHQGYAYADCENSRTRCLALTATCNQDCVRNSSCQVLVRITYTHLGTVDLYVRRYLYDRYPAYVSVGVSPTASMEDTLVFDCMKQPFDMLSTELSYNYGRVNQLTPITQRMPSSITFGTLNNLECLWSISYDRAYSTRGFGMQFSRNAYHLLVAIGSITNRMVAANNKEKHILKAATSTQLVIRPDGITDTPGIGTEFVSCLIPPPPSQIITVAPTASTTITTTTTIMTTMATTTTTTTTIKPTIVSQTSGSILIPAIDSDKPKSDLTGVATFSTTPSKGAGTDLRESGPTTAGGKLTSAKNESGHSGTFLWILTLVVFVILIVPTTWGAYKVFKGSGRVERRNSAKTHQDIRSSHGAVGAHVNMPSHRVTPPQRGTPSLRYRDIGTPSGSSVPSHITVPSHRSAVGKLFESPYSSGSHRVTGHSGISGQSGASGPSRTSSPSHGSGSSHRTLPSTGVGTLSPSEPSRVSAPSTKSGSPSHGIVSYKQSGSAGTSGQSQISAPSTKGGSSSHGIAPSEQSRPSGTTGPSQISYPSDRSGRSLPHNQSTSRKGHVHHGS